MLVPFKVVSKAVNVSKMQAAYAIVAWLAAFNNFD
jgi:hypothetical protein